jgi:hypothetical protein
MTEQDKSERELLPCPFCGNSRIALVPVSNGRAMQCGECEAVGPRTIFMGDEAADYWNDRAAAIGSAP